MRSSPSAVPSTLGRAGSGNLLQLDNQVHNKTPENKESLLVASGNLWTLIKISSGYREVLPWLLSLFSTITILPKTPAILPLLYYPTFPSWHLKSVLSYLLPSTFSLGGAQVGGMVSSFQITHLCRKDEEKSSFLVQSLQNQRFFSLSKVISKHTLGTCSQGLSLSLHDSPTWVCATPPKGAWVCPVLLEGRR